VMENTNQSKIQQLSLNPQRIRADFLVFVSTAIGVEFGSRLVTLTDGPDAGKKCKLQVWDTAGQVR